jgi:hypothetical protein
MYKVEKVTPYCPAGHEQQPDYFTVAVRGRRWGPMPKYATQEGAEVLCLLMNQAFTEGQEDMKEAFRQLLNLAVVDHEH